MDTAIITTYCLAGDRLQARRHQESPQRTVTDAEVMTTAIVAARFFGGNFETASELLSRRAYFGHRLSRSRFNRRLHLLASLLESFFEWLGRVHKATSCEPVFLIDSCPIKVCDNIRIDRCRIYPKTATAGAFRGYQSSKRRFFYGLKVHAVTTAEGVPVEVSLTPGSYSDTKHLRRFELDLPEESVLYGDKAYNMETKLTMSTLPKTSWPTPAESTFFRTGRRTRRGLFLPGSNTSSRSIARRLRQGSAY